MLDLETIESREETIKHAEDRAELRLNLYNR